MLKSLLTLMVLLFSGVVFCQQNYPVISIGFNNDPIKNALIKVEEKSGFTFYYRKEWLSAYDDVLISKEFTSEKLNIVLDALLSETNLNYFITGQKIILTQNIRIHKVSYNNFFGEVAGAETTVNDSLQENIPVFYKEYNENLPPEDSLKNNVDTDKSLLKDRLVTKNTLKLIGKEKETTEQKQHFFELTGYITGTENKQGIPNVVIRTKDNKINTISDVNGFYSLKLPAGTNSLEVISIGYNTIEQDVVLFNEGTIDFSLTESVTELGEVVVSGNKNKPVRQTATGVTTINIQSIKTVPLVLGERDIVKVALTMPGVKTAGEGSQGLNVRGGKADQNLILLDNGVIYNPFHLFGLFSAINSYTIGSADIYKGSIPIEYGGRLSSVFDIKTKDGDMNKLKGEGGIGPITGNLMVTTPIIKGKSSLTTAIRTTYSGWVLNMMDDNDIKDSKANFYDGIISYKHVIDDKNNLKFTGYYSNDRFNITGDSLLQYNNRLMSVEWNHVLNEKNMATLYLNNSGYKFGIDYDDNDTPEKNFKFGFKMHETELKLKMSYFPNKKHAVVYGIASKLYGVNPGYLNPQNKETVISPIQVDKERALESAVFVGDKFGINNKVSVSGGLRLSMFNAIGPSVQYTYANDLPLNDVTVTGSNQYGSGEFFKTYFGLEYRVAARYNITDDFSVKAGYDTNYQYIHLLSTNTTQSPVDTWKLSDNNITPESSNQFSLGFFKNFSEDNYELSLEGYYKKMNDVLDYKMGAEMLLNQSIERDIIQAKGKAYGLEFLVKKNHGILTGWIGYTYSRAFLRTSSKFENERINNNQYYPANYDKPHDLSMVLNYKLTKRYSLSTNFVYQTGRPITLPAGSYHFSNAYYAFYSNRNEHRIPDYYRLDFGVNIEGNHRIKKLAHSFWNISVYNLLGRNNPYSVYFVTENGEIKGYKTSIFAVPIPTITYNFKF